jgi:CRP-like cAMP-binding protein
MEYPLSQLRKYHPLSKAFIRDLGSRIRRIEVKKNNTLLLRGDIATDLYLIEEGMLACYDHDENGNKYCSWLMRKGDFVTSTSSFNKQEVSTEVIIAETDCILWAITRQDFDHLTETYAEFRDIRQKLTDLYHSQSREMDVQRKRDPEVFYEYLVKNYPALVAEASVTALASLMGISRQKLHGVIKLRKAKRR